MWHYNNNNNTLSAKDVPTRTSFFFLLFSNARAYTATLPQSNGTIVKRAEEETKVKNNALIPRGYCAIRAIFFSPIFSYGHFRLRALYVTYFSSVFYIRETVVVVVTFIQNNDGVMMMMIIIRKRSRRKITTLQWAPANRIRAADVAIDPCRRS